MGANQDINFSVPHSIYSANRSTNDTLAWTEEWDSRRVCNSGEASLRHATWWPRRWSGCVRSRKNYMNNGFSAVIYRAMSESEPGNKTRNIRWIMKVTRWNPGTRIYISLLLHNRRTRIIVWLGPTNYGLSLRYWDWSVENECISGIN